jgi:hypothetical protein
MRRASTLSSGMYCRSTLTRLLKESLTSAKIFFLACCSPAACCAPQTGQTLKYAAIVKRITTSAEDSAILLESRVDTFPTKFLQHRNLEALKRIPRSDDPAVHPVYLCELRARVVRVMISHRWLSPSLDRRAAHPDTTDNKKHELVCAVFQRMVAEGWLTSLDVAQWIDFCAFCVFSVFFLAFI